MTQRQLIAKYIDDFGAITPMDAFIDLGITKLSTRIGEMIKDGEQISKKTIHAKNRYGKKVHYMRYSRM
jgi:hypothetical protein